ncbi:MULTISPECIES: hypothetical protein [Bacillaceae]|uniref:hypothetical protein n=2 Tax=Bacillales TaxID=1385 RepID=UPI001E549BB9|nr:MULTISPECIES: hypothetical protein [Bacillaceae]MCE4047018.1 hypothetical protein [Bacillus sp. Au-Bac7]MDL0436571.1 hypothetical protein [Niallia sp. SS-2023]
MKDNRKTVIIQEILYWKKNKMLPEHYCDYLLTLYTEGNRMKEEELPKQKHIISSAIFLLFIPITVGFLYFTELSFILQMAISLIFLIITAAGIFYYQVKGLGNDIPVTVAAFIVLLFSVKAVLHFFPEKIIFLYIILTINCLLWFIGGRKFKLVYFTISSYIGFLLLAVLVFMSFRA